MSCRIVCRSVFITSPVATLHEREKVRSAGIIALLCSGALSAVLMYSGRETVNHIFDVSKKEIRIKKMYRTRPALPNLLFPLLMNK